MIPRPTRSTPFPYTTLFRSQRLVERRVLDGQRAAGALAQPGGDRIAVHGAPREGAQDEHVERAVEEVGRRAQDRKSTRLNSSHANKPYAVFCLTKNDPPPLH